MRPEQKLILMMSRFQPEPESIESARQLLDDNSVTFDHDELFRSSAMNGVAGIVYRNLGGIYSPPERIARKVEQLYFSTVKTNLLLSYETMKIILLLRTAGMDAMPLKGPIFADLCLNDVGLYPSSDIDLLLRPDDIPKAEAILISEGYRKIFDLLLDDFLASTYHVSYTNGDFVIELHWNLVTRYFNADPEFWWGDTVKTGYAGSEILLPSHEKYILYAIFRLFSRAFRPLRYSFFVSALIQTHPVNWHGLISHSEMLGMKNLTVFTLEFMRDIHGVKIPPEILGHRSRFYGIFVRLITSGLFNDTGRTSLRMLAFTALLDRPGETIKLLLKRIFPNLGEIRLRYGLSRASKKVYLYYALNPFILLLRKN